MPPRRFSDADLERWVERGIITAQQREAALADLSGRPSDEGLQLTTLLYYGGGLLVLLAYAVFLGFQWEGANEAARVAIAGASLAFFAAASYALSRQEGQFRLPAELLQLVTIAIVPLLTYAVLDAAGLWPDSPTDPLGRFDAAVYAAYDAARADYERDLTFARMAVAAPALLVALAAFRWSRSPFVLVPIAAAITSLAIDITLLGNTADHGYDLETGQVLVIAGIGAALFTTGVYVRGRYERDYSLLLYAMGLAGLALGLGSLAFDGSAAWGWGVLWLAISLSVFALSIPLKERLLAAAGLAAIYGYFARLVFDVYESANAAFALIVLGLLVIAAGVIYQRLTEGVPDRDAT